MPRNVFEQVQLTLVKNINTKSAPCHEDQDYNSYFLSKLTAWLAQQYNCTVPFLPRSVVDGVPIQICSNPLLGFKAHMAAW